MRKCMQLDKDVANALLELLVIPNIQAYVQNLIIIITTDLNRVISQRMIIMEHNNPSKTNTAVLL